MTRNTREAILAEFKVDKHGIIQDLGKFEGEMLYAPYFYDLLMEDGQDDNIEAQDGSHNAIFFIEDEDRREFPELVDEALYVWESDSGFFECKQCSKKEWEVFKALVEAELEPEE